jgi:hypothetical protein
MAKEMKKPGSPKGTPGKAAGPAKAKATKKALKRPTGELPKRNSRLAKFIKSSDSGKGFTKAETRTAAGKYRDAEKAAGPKGFGSLDKSGVALGKAEAATKKMRKPVAAKPAGRKPKSGSGVASKVAKRAKTVAREVRDVKTALSNTYRAGVAQAQYPGFNDNKQQLKKTVKALKKQVKEVGTAAITGKKGTTAGSTRTSMYDKRPPQKFSKNIIPTGVEYKKGTKRK